MHALTQKATWLFQEQNHEMKYSNISVCNQNIAQLKHKFNNNPKMLNVILSAFCYALFSKY